MGNRARPYAVKVAVGAIAGGWEHYYTTRRGDSTYHWWRDSAGSLMILRAGVVPQEINSREEADERRKLWLEWRALRVSGQKPPKFSAFVKARRGDKESSLAENIAPTKEKPGKKSAPGKTPPPTDKN